MKYKILSIFALLFTLTVTPFSYADHNHCFSGKRIEKIVDQLNLTADQKEKIKAIRQQAKQDLMPVHKQMVDNRHAFRDLLKAGPVDNSKLNDLIDKEKNVLASIIKIRMNERKDIVNVLNDEQRKKLVNMMENMEKQDIVN